MPATANTTALIITDCLQKSIGYGEKLLADIPAEKFAHMPHPTMNHPAFIIGHLALYPDRLLPLVKKPELASPRDGYSELFEGGATCVEQDGRYPEKDDLAGYYLDRYRVLADVLPEVPDEVFAEPNPMEGRIAEFFPTVGIMVNFMANNHHMMHLGQLSAWRRAIGLGPVM